MFQITINENSVFNVSDSPDGMMINDVEWDWEMQKLPDGSFSILANGKSYVAMVERIDPINKQMTISVNGNVFQLSIGEPIDLILKKMGLNMAASKKVDAIKAPMPGLVLKVLVEEGQSLKKGDPVLVLEAMKMENVFKAPADALVKSVKINEGEAVEKGVVLIELE